MARCNNKYTSYISVAPLQESQSHYTIYDEVVQKCAEFADPQTLERIDLQIEITPLSFNEMSQKERGESSAVIRERVIKARHIQEERFKDAPGVHCNAQMTSRLMHRYAEPDEAGMTLLREAMNRLQLSARAYDRILRVARTIADLEGSENIQSHHLGEAIGYRNLDRSTWGE